MNSIDKLIQIFSEFPGIGPKQARRFVYFLINRNEAYIEELKNQISELRKGVSSCFDCKRYFFSKFDTQTLCSICSDKTRDTSILMIVSRDIDLENIEKGHSFLGKYFVLGGLVPILDKNPEQRIRLKELLALVSRMSDKGLKEIILGLDANSEAEYTGNILKTSLSPITEKYSIKISELGRGLSTGTELEYSDPETIKNALKNRS
ncbi:MAG: recombination protein RecR [Parcubacteria group bacterium Gr01-1014_46]|nr:MAG: recombination protein RecR [Parcubacteria group bacterium Gr01-1014_46]